MESSLDTQVATIGSGAALSNAVEVNQRTPVSIQLPAAWTSAVVTFQASYNGETFADVYFDEAEYSVSVDADYFVSLDPRAILGARAIKVRSGTSGTPVNQGAERLIQVQSRGF